MCPHTHVVLGIAHRSNVHSKSLPPPLSRCVLWSDPCVLWSGALLDLRWDLTGSIHQKAAVRRTAIGKLSGQLGRLYARAVICSLAVI